MAQRLREVEGDNVTQQGIPQGQRLVEVSNSGTTSQMSREEVDALKERQDIRVHDEGDKATVLHRLR